MPESDMENILIMAIFLVTRDDVLACANELGIPEERITDDVIELVQEEVTQGLGGWREAIREIVKEAIIKEAIMKEDATKCPLGLVCSPHCAWREVGQCISLSEVK